MLNYKISNVFDKNEAIEFYKRIGPIKRYNCICGGSFTINSKDRHKITKQHRKFIAKNKKYKIKII